MTPELARDHYQFVSIVTQSLSAHGVPYFAFAGSLLGAIRHRGFIPWDDDFDVMIEVEHAAVLGAAIEDLREWGVSVNPKSTAGFVQLTIRNPRLPQSLSKYLAFDIFMVERHTSEAEDTSLRFVDKRYLSWHPNNYLLLDEVFPMTERPFGPLRIWTPGRPETYLRRMSLSLTEAVVRMHQGDNEALARDTENLRSLGLYPIPIDLIEEAVSGSGQILPEFLVLQASE